MGWKLDVLAKFLVGNEAKKSIELQIGKESAKEWAELRSSTPLIGYYPNIEKAIKGEIKNEV